MQLALHAVLKIDARNSATPAREDHSHSLNRVIADDKDDLRFHKYEQPGETSAQFMHSKGIACDLRSGEELHRMAGLLQETDQLVMPHEGQRCRPEPFTPNREKAGPIQQRLNEERRGMARHAIIVRSRNHQRPYPALSALRDQRIAKPLVIDAIDFGE